MKRTVIFGVLLIVAGVACIFPFIRALVLENIAVMLGVYLIYRGYLYLTAPTKCSGACKSNKPGAESGLELDCPPVCKK